MCRHTKKNIPHERGKQSWNGEMKLKWIIKLWDKFQSPNGYVYVCDVYITTVLTEVTESTIWAEMEFESIITPKFGKSRYSMESTSGGGRKGGEKRKEIIRCTQHLLKNGDNVESLRYPYRKKGKNDRLFFTCKVRKGLKSHTAENQTKAVSL